MSVEPLDERRYRAWDEFVLAHPYGSPFHLTAWKDTIGETFPYEPIYLTAMSGNTIRGILPLFLVRNWVMGQALISSPFAVYGGALFDSEQARLALAESTRELAHSLGVEYVELRNGHNEQSLGFQRVCRHVTFTGPIGPNEETLLNSIPRKTRRIVRKSLTQNFETRIETENFEAFERLYAQNLRRLGTPAFPPAYFAAMLRNFRGNIDIREVVLEGKAVAAVLTLYFRDQVLPYYGAADERFKVQAPSTFMYYDLMQSCGKSNYTFFDFGRSKIESSSSQFKAHWGLEQRMLTYEMLLVKRKELPNYTPTNHKFDLAMRIWRQMPLALTRLVGPHLIKLFP